MELAPAIEAEKPEIKGAVEATAVNQTVLAEPENKSVVSEVEEAEVIVPAAEPVKTASEPPAPEPEAIKPPVVDDTPGAPDSDGEPHRAHMVVDDPGVDESKPAPKTQSGLRLF